MTPPDPKWFYLHVMKTGGATLRWNIMANFERSQVYPFKRLDPDLYAANYRIDYLTALPAARRASIRVFTGHFPFVAVELLGVDAITLTCVRDPIDRTLSYLRHCKRYNEQHRAMALEEIYEDAYQFPRFIKDHQAKLFAMTAADHPESYMDVLDVDAGRLVVAKANLERVDVLGLQDRSAQFFAELERRFGWQFGRAPDQRVSDGASVAASFRRRIADDNAADVEFYVHARELYERRGIGR